MIATSFLSHSSATDYSDSPEYLDIQPLTLSGHGDLDDFDFLLDVEDNDALTSTSEDGMDLVHQFETLESSLNSMHFHTIEETISCSSAEEEDMLPLPSFSNDGYYQTKRNQGQHHQQQQYFRVHHQVNFDPPMQCQQPQQADLPRQASVSDMSMCSYATAHSSATFSHHHHHHHQQQPSHHDAAAQRSSSFLHSEAQQQQHHKLVDQAQQIGEALQLQKLAESMQRTELSRKQVMLHRDSMPVEQRRRQLRALREIKEAQQQQQRDHDQVHHYHHQLQSQYQVQNHQAQQQIQHQMQQQQTSHSSEDGCCNHQQHRSSIVAASFSGYRSTLTNGLELSKRQLGLYMSTI